MELYNIELNFSCMPLSFLQNPDVRMVYRNHQQHYRMMITQDVVDVDDDDGDDNDDDNDDENDNNDGSANESHSCSCSCSCSSSSCFCYCSFDD